MLLTRIEAQNVKGATFSHELSKLVAIVGPNFANKTTILDAIRLALIGYLPEVGKRASATWELSSGREMAVSVTLDSGKGIMREFFDGKEGIIANSTDTEWSDLPLLNAEHYFTLTDSQRVQYVFERVKLDEAYTADGIIAAIEQLSLEEAHTEPVEKAKREVILAIRRCFVPTNGSATPTVQDGIAMAVRQLKDQFTYWNSRQKETVAAARVLTELKNREAEVSAVSIADLDVDVKRFEGELAELNQQKGKMAAEAESTVRIAGRKKQLEGILNKDRTDYDRVIERLQAQIADAKKQIKPITITQEEVERYEDAAPLTTLRAEVKSLNDRAVGVHSQLEKLASQTACPYCKSDAPDWKKNVDKELRQQFDDLTAQWREKTLLLEGMERGYQTLGQAIKDARDQRNLNEEWKRTIKTCEHGIEMAKHDKEADQLWRSDCQTELDSLNQQNPPEHVEAQLATVVEAIANVQTALGMVKASKRKAEDLQQDLKRAAQSQIDHIDAKAHVAVIKAIGGMLNGIRAGMIDATFTKLLGTANSLCAGILRSPLAMHDGTIGRWDGHKFIPHHVFSGVEKALAYVSIATALSATAPLKLLLLDELGRMTTRTRIAVLSNISNNIAQGNLDQAIVVIPVDAEDAPIFTGISDWQVIPMFP